MSSLSWSQAQRRRGASLIEVMIASVILAILALAGSAFVYRSRADIALQKNRRVAIELANSRLEKLMYTWSLTDVAGLDGSPVDETLSINGRSGYHRVTTVQVTGSDHDECLRIIVSMQYNIRNGTDVVRFETLRGR